jgi:hypothetical protein
MTARGREDWLAAPTWSIYVSQCLTCGVLTACLFSAAAFWLRFIHCSVPKYFYFTTMKYQAQLTPWIVYQVSETDRIAVTRYRRRNDADAYAKRLSMSKPGCEFLVAFDTDSFAPKTTPDAELATV